jgi:hypothetical protein
MSMLFREEESRASCGCALQIFPDAMTDNILVIDRREPFHVMSIRRTVGEAEGLHVKSVAAYAKRTPPHSR